VFSSETVWRYARRHGGSTQYSLERRSVSRGKRRKKIKKRGLRRGGTHAKRKGEKLVYFSGCMVVLFIYDLHLKDLGEGDGERERKLGGKRVRKKG